MRQPTHNEHLRLLTQIWATINSRYSRGDKMAARSQHQISLMAINSRRGFHLKTSNRMAMMTNHDDGDQQRRWSHDDDDQFTGMFPLEDGRISMAMIGSPFIFGMMTRETMDEPPNVTYAKADVIKLKMRKFSSGCDKLYLCGWREHNKHNGRQ